MISKDILITGVSVKDQKRIAKKILENIIKHEKKKFKDQNNKNR